MKKNSYYTKSLKRNMIINEDIERRFTSFLGITSFHLRVKLAVNGILEILSSSLHITESGATFRKTRYAEVVIPKALP